MHKDYNIDPPGRHWLDLDIQHSWHQNDSAPYHNVFFPRRLLFLFLLPQYFCEISCRSWGHALSQTNRETQAWKTEDYFLAHYWTQKQQRHREMIRRCLGNDAHNLLILDTQWEKQVWHLESISLSMSESTSLVCESFTPEPSIGGHWLGLCG